MKFLRLILVMFIFIFFTACTNAPIPKIPKNANVFTTINMWYVHGKLESSKMYGGASSLISGDLIPVMHAEYRNESTNYMKGTLLPVNSPVELLLIEENNIFFKFEGKIYGIRNVFRHSKVDINTILKRSFSQNKIDLSRFLKIEQKSIFEGVARIGMSRDAVLITRGYPPAHITPYLSSNSWRYWKSKLNSRKYHFLDGKYTGYTE